tara:strand:- start:3478 stop:4269 length:792 start_codon:yes stop_codon:yes gene_type:complete
MALAFDKAADVFFRAFKDCTNHIIKSLPNDINTLEATQAIHAITQQLNGDYARLVHVVNTVHARVAQDETWATMAAVDVYEQLAKAVDTNLSIPNLPMRGPYLVRNELMKTCQAQFQQMMSAPTWSRGFMAFLGQLCTVGNITSTTPGILTYVLDGMISSSALDTSDNFDILMNFFMRAGPCLDGQPQLGEHLTMRIQKLQERAKMLKLSERLAVYGLVQLRERGWREEELNAGSRSEQQVTDATSTWMSGMGFASAGDLNGR